MGNDIAVYMEFWYLILSCFACCLWECNHFLCLHCMGSTVGVFFPLGFSKAVGIGSTRSAPAWIGLPPGCSQGRECCILYAVHGC